MYSPLKNYKYESLFSIQFQFKLDSVRVMGLKVSKSCSKPRISIKPFCPSACCTKNANRQQGGQNFKKYILQFKKPKRVHKSDQCVSGREKIPPSNKKGAGDSMVSKTTFTNPT